MSSEKNKAIVRRLIEAENKYNPTLLDEFIAPDFVDEPLYHLSTMSRMSIILHTLIQLSKGF